MSVDKRTALLEAAEAVLVEHGLGGATVEQITARAGVAKGTYYLYFKSKADVVAALQQRLWDGLMHAALATAARLETDDLWTAIDAFLESVVDYEIEHRVWHQLVAQGWTAPFDQETVNEQQMIDLFADQIRQAVARGDVDRCDEEMTATLLYRALQGATHQFCQAPGDPDRDRMVGAFKWFVRKVLAPAGQPVPPAT